MPIELRIMVPDDMPAGKVGDAAMTQWLAFHVKPKDSQIKLADRAGLSYRAFRHFMQKTGLTLESLLEIKAGDSSMILEKSEPEEPGYVEDTDAAEPCQFCGSTIKVHLHHVVNRYDSPVMVALCSKCHRKFHFLNKLYRPPIAKAKRGKAVTMR